MSVCSTTCLYTDDVGEDLEEEDDEDEEEDDEEEEEDEDEDEEDEAEFEAEEMSSTRSLPTESSSRQPTLDARARFSTNLLLLNGPDLGYIVRTIECECPQAIERGQAVPEKMEILVDELDSALFTKLGQYANEKSAARRRKLNIPTAAPPINDISNKRKRKR